MGRAPTLPPARHPDDVPGHVSALLNILGDFDDERARLVDMQKAVLNILGDSDDERARLVDMQKAVLNVLGDSEAERDRMGEAQRAVLNILDDLEVEKARVDRANDDLSAEVAERQRAEAALHDLAGQLEVQVRSRTAELTASNRELEAFAYSAAHDLRTPLRAIAGLSDILVDAHAGEDGEELENLRRIRAAAVRMGQLIDSLLLLARLTRVSIHEEDVDLTAMARDHMEELRASAPGRTVDAHVQDDLRARGDARLLRLVMRNLLDNAFKFSVSRERAHVEVGRAASGHGEAFYVRDDGVGFDPRGAGLLFGQFQRLHTDRDFTGLSVGLAAVDRIVRRHGGRVWAESTPGTGSTFYFQLGMEGSADG